MERNLLPTITLIALTAIFSSGSTSAQKNEKVKKESYGTTKGKEVFLFTLTNKAGNFIKLTNWGARITRIEVPDKEGKKDNVTFGFDTFDAMIKGDRFSGAVVGRFANRIAGGKFTLDGKEISLPVNDGKNSIHGGPGGYQTCVWDAEIVKGAIPSVRFTLISPDGDQNYPGNLKVEVKYTWTNKNELILEYKCTTDKKTIINLTNHAYFNLHGAGNGDILDHVLQINASKFTVIDAALIPTGEIRSVAGTPLDFTSPHAIGERIKDSYEQVKIGRGGYDHNFVLNAAKDVAVTVYDPLTGRVMEVLTDQPGVQFYSGNFLNGRTIGSGGKPYNYRAGFALETQHFPDSPNHDNFPSTVLDAGETFKTKTIYRFSVK